jgi:hypothetical protein
MDNWGIKESLVYDRNSYSKYIKREINFSKQETNLNQS